MKILLVGAGASFSTKDIETGYFEALQKVQGIETHLYLLDKRLEVAVAWTKFFWKKFRNSDPNSKPTWADSVYRAGIEALEMALRYEVDWVVVVSAMYLHPDVIVMMRRAGLKICVLFTESPYEDEKQKVVADLVQLCSTNERTSVEALGPHCFYLAHAYSGGSSCASTILRKNELSEKIVSQGVHDVVFVGSGFQERIDLLKGVDWTGIDLGLYGAWTLLGPKDKLRQYIKHGVVSNSTALRLYSNAKIGINLHRTSMEYRRDSPKVSYAESLNPRAFELAANGTFCLTDFRAEGTEIFGDSQPVFEGPKDLRYQIEWYLEHETQRLDCIRKARWAVEGHTYDTRVIDLLERLGGYGSGH